jgi:DNA repair exonuclease SbcCD ATPase subunit
LNEIDQLEQELIALRQRFTQSLEVLEDLAHVREKFDTLSNSYQLLQSYIDEAKMFLETAATQSAEPRLAHLEAEMDMRHEQLQAQLTNLRFDSDATARQLREEVELEQQKLASLSQNSGQLQGGVEDANRIKWLESSLQHLNSSVYTDRAALQKLDRRVATIKRTVDIIAVVGFVGFMVMLLIFFISK